MVDICKGASATGNNAFHPGESILMAGESFQALDDASGSSPGGDNGIGLDNDADNVPASDDEVCPNPL
jgi:hypothetical protein